jgi:hypothetical protein
MCLPEQKHARQPGSDDAHSVPSGYFRFEV